MSQVLLLIALAGLLLPGFGVARLCGARLFLAWASAFPLSCLILTEVVIAFTICGLPLRFASVLIALAIVVVVTLLVASRQSAVDVVPDDTTQPGDIWLRLLAAVVTLVVTLVLVGITLRTTLYPLSGYDTVFRWEGLARVMLADEGLAHYPPITAADFDHYTYPDGVPPLVATVYWWLYAALGEPRPGITSLSVLLQIASCCGLAYAAAQLQWGRCGGLIAVAALVSANLFLGGVVIGQETGYTALSVAGQLACALAAAREPRAGPVILAGLFGALGALAREYGPALALCGVLILACQRDTRRYIPLFCVTVALFGAPWYLRNWVRSGNPLYSIDIGLGLPINRVHAGIMAIYREMFGARGSSPYTWLYLAARSMTGATLALFGGVAGALLIGRRGAALIGAALVTLGLWCWSLPYTSGDLNYSLRVLTPAWVALSIAAGAVGPWFVARPALAGKIARCGFLVIFALCGGYAAACSWAHPSDVTDLPGIITASRQYPDDQLGHLVAAAQALEKTPLPPLGVLTDDAFLAAALQRSSRFRPVMAWSPEVDFLADPQLGVDEATRQLCERKIGLVSLVRGHNSYWRQFPFYRAGMPQWLVLRETAEWQPIFLVPCPCEDSGGAPLP